MAEVILNEEEKRYEITTDGILAKLEYILSMDKIFLTHTEVPQSLGGSGIGSKLVKYALEDIERKGLTLVPLCPFVAQYIKNHPEYKELVFKGIKIKEHG